MLNENDIPYRADLSNPLFFILLGLALSEVTVMPSEQLRWYNLLLAQDMLLLFVLLRICFHLYAMYLKCRTRNITHLDGVSFNRYSVISTYGPCNVINVLCFYTTTFRCVCAVPRMAVCCSSLMSWFPVIIIVVVFFDVMMMMMMIIIPSYNHPMAVGVTNEFLFWHQFICLFLLTVKLIGIMYHIYKNAVLSSP